MEKAFDEFCFIKLNIEIKLFNLKKVPITKYFITEKYLIKYRKVQKPTIYLPVSPKLMEEMELLRFKTKDCTNHSTASTLDISIFCQFPLFPNSIEATKWP